MSRLHQLHLPAAAHPVQYEACKCVAAGAIAVGARMVAVHVHIG